LRKALSPKHQALSTNDKEFMAVVFAVKKWRHYLLGRHFIIKTDYFNLKYLMQQKITTEFQSKWLSKLMGFDYEICYKNGKENVVADRLSRISAAQIVAMLVSSVNSELLESVKQSWQTDDKIQSILNRLSSGESILRYSLSQGLLYENGRLAVGSNMKLRSHIIKLFYDLAFGGHFVVVVTGNRIACLFLVERTQQRC